MKKAAEKTLTVKVQAPLKRIGGSQSDHWNNVLANQAMQALWVKNSSPEERDKQLSATVAALIGIDPQDEVEGMIAAQMLASHNAAMECYRRAMLAEQSFEGRNMNLAHAAKASRTHAALVEALNRHRGKGQQKVTVEHVHVAQGGQAIVGNVNAAGEGGGAREKIGEQPHALEHAPGVAMPSQIEAERAAMPSAGSAGA
jgi:hypothetical protein